MAYEKREKPERKKKCEDCSTLVTSRAQRCRSCFSKIRRSFSKGFLGKKHSLVSKEKIKNSITELFIEKTNHPRWKVDRTKIKVGERFLNDPLQKGWRKAVKDRDGWKCKISNNNCKGRLEAHHILTWKDYPELRYEVNNGITLCQAHHPRKKEDVVKLSPYFHQMVASLD